MANLIDYLDWRSDLSFKESPFNEIDALVLCQLSYINFDNILKLECTDKKSIRESCKCLKQLWNEFSSQNDFSSRSDMGALINPLSIELFKKAAKSRRFGSVLAGAYVNRIDLKLEEQFSAVTFFKDKPCKNPFVAFRGTDDTLVGWKEDFNMITLDVIPAQKSALDYLTNIAKSTNGKINVSGHSKGGNAAVFASAYIEPKYKKRIVKVYNNDGPGFTKSVVESKEMKSIEGVLHSYYPELSIVGMLFEHFGNFTVIESDDRGIMQHDPFSWHVMPLGFVTLPGLTKETLFFHQMFNTWVSSLAMDKRKTFVDTLFSVLEASGAKTNSELEENWLKNSPQIIMALRKIDRETRGQVLSVMDLLFKSMKKNMPAVKGLEFLSNLGKKKSE